MLERLTPSRPTRSAAEAFGRALAVTHAAGAEAFGQPPDGWTGDGYIGQQPMSMRTDNVGPVLRRAADAAVRAPGPRDRQPESDGGALGGAGVPERLVAGEFDDEPIPARIHGDLWSGNVIFTADRRGHDRPGRARRPWADRSGHAASVRRSGTGGAHRRVCRGRRARGGRWADLIGLHQLHPLLVHAVSHGPRTAPRPAGSPLATPSAGAGPRCPRPSAGSLCGKRNFTADTGAHLRPCRINVQRTPGHIRNERLGHAADAPGPSPDRRRACEARRNAQAGPPVRAFAERRTRSTPAADTRRKDAAKAVSSRRADAAERARSGRRGRRAARLRLDELHDLSLIALVLHPHLGAP